jgi:hypothetical protein
MRGSRRGTHVMQSIARAIAIWLHTMLLTLPLCWTDLGLLKASLIM